MVEMYKQALHQVIRKRIETFTMYIRKKGINNQKIQICDKCEKRRIFVQKGSYYISDNNKLIRFRAKTVLISFHVLFDMLYNDH